MQKKGEGIQYIMNSSIGHVLCKGLSSLYKQKPQFPIKYLGNWLKEYSKSQIKANDLISSKVHKQQRYKQYHQIQKVQQQQLAKKIHQQNHKLESKERQFLENVYKHQYLEDLLVSWLPQYFTETNHLTGCYVGYLTHRRKKIQQNNFEPGAEFDTDNPKVIEYIGASKNHQSLMIEKILPNDCGRSYDALNIPEDEPENPDGEQVPKPKVQRKKYIYVPDVLKDQKINYFKYPKLGCYVCYPLKIQSCLFQAAFDKGIIDYKQHLKIKEEAQRQYFDKLSELRAQTQEAKKKYQQFEANDDQTSKAEKEALSQAYNKLFSDLQTLESNPPKNDDIKFELRQKSFIIGCDTLGQDVKLSEQALDQLQKKVLFFKKQWQSKQYKMLMNDVLAYVEDENLLDGTQNAYRQAQKTAIDGLQATLKQQFPNSQKQVQFQLSVAKCQKVKYLLRDEIYSKSMKVYFNYCVPKYRQILQIGLMLLRYKKSDINLPNSNSLNWRKVRNHSFIHQFLIKVEECELRREQSEEVGVQYKITKLLERIQKIDLEQVSRFNSWIWMLANIIRLICWTRIQCRDVKIEQHERRLKMKQERDLQITKYQEQLLKALQTTKAQLTEENRESFNEQDWRKSYGNENPKPEPFQVLPFKPHLDIE